jgi:DNA-binding beta-propeller fold protein YncE
MKTNVMTKSAKWRLLLPLVPLVFAHAQTIPTGTFPMSAAATPDGKYLLVMNSSATLSTISVIDLATNKELSRTPVPDVWQGLALTKAGDKLYVGGGSRAAVFEFLFSNGTLTAGRTFPIVAAKDRTTQDFAGDVKLAPDGHLLYIANLFRDMVVVMNPQSGLILSRIKTGRRPYRILFHPSGKTMYVSSWADGTIGQYNVDSGARLDNVHIAPQPTDMLWVDGGVPGADLPDVKARMFVAAANTNSVYVYGANESGNLNKLESINLALTPRQPLGTTPSAIGLSVDKKQVYVACSDANDVAVIDISGDRNLVKGFIPTGLYPTSVVGLAEGRVAVLNGRGNSVQLVDAQDDAKLDSDTAEVMAKFAYRDEMLDAPTPPAGNPVQAAGPIKHVIYVVRAASGSTDWLTSAIESDYTARVGNRFSSDNSAPDPASLPPAGYLWNAASQAGLKIRNYGFQVHNLPKPTPDGEQIDRVYDPALTSVTDMEYRGPDPAYPDTDRATEFANELKEYEQLGEMPQLLLVRIGTDDHALAIIEDALSKSKFRGETAMFVVESGTASHVISRWLGNQATSNYNQLSALRTIEIILGLRPMTVFDAAAPPMFSAFAGAPAAQ